MIDSRSLPRPLALALVAVGALLMLAAFVRVGWVHEYALKLFEDGWTLSEFPEREYENRSLVHFFRCGLLAIVGLVVFCRGLRDLRTSSS